MISLSSFGRNALIIIAWVAFVQPTALATDHLVDSRNDISQALNTAQPGDQILIAPGTYAGGFFQADLTGVTIRSQHPHDPAIIQGGNNGIQLSDATDVTIEHLVFDGAAFNGLNIDDGGSFNSPSSNITLRDLVIRDVGSGGNHDGIKLSGVTGFLIDRVQMLNWGTGGSAVDPVGSHHGLVQNSLFRHDSLGDGGSVLRPKGGSKDIVLRANRIDVPIGSGRAIQAGGSTGSAFFRFVDGDCCYEASDIVAEGNVILGGGSAFNFVNIDGGIFHHNYAQRRGSWTLRILNENQGLPIVDTQNGQLLDTIPLCPLPPVACELRV